LKENLDNLILGKIIRVSVGSVNISIKVVMDTVFDLPALSTVMNHTRQRQIRVFLLLLSWSVTTCSLKSMAESMVLYM